MRPSWAGALIPHIHGDPFFSSVRLLMHFEGAADSRPVVDVKGHTGSWLSINDPHSPPDGPPSGIVTVAPLMGASSVRFAPYGSTFTGFATGAVIAMDASADYAIAGDFTIEFLLRPEGAWRNAGSIFSILTTLQDGGAAVVGDWGFSKDSAGALLFTLEKAGPTAVNVAAPSANWAAVGDTSAIAAQRSGDTLMLFVNGVLQATNTGVAGTTLASTRPIGIGAAPDWPLGPGYLNDHSAGLFDEFRITAAARYSAGGYTPAVTPFPDR